MPSTRPITLDGRHLRCRDVENVARHGAPIGIDSDARQRVAASRAAAMRVAGRQPVYGLSTGVGANRDVPVDDVDMSDHGMRVLRSHAARTGPVEDDETVRATMLIRLNQLLAGGSGVRIEVVDALTAAVQGDALPTVHRYGTLGTGDLSPLAEIGLTLAGELPWRFGGGTLVRFVAGEALAFMSSSALSLATATLARGDLAQLVDASHVVAALSFLALGGNPEAYDPTALAARPHAGAVRVAADLHRLVGMPAAQRIQDPFALRALPQVNGVAVEALERLRNVLEIEVNAAAENPLIVAGANEPRALHHGQFHATEVAAALDSARLGIASVTALSSGRLGALLEPDLTGLPVFLTGGPAGSSGVLLLEYVAHDVLAEIQHAAAPVTTGTAVISRGLEDHASFAAQAARYTDELSGLVPTALACELVAAVRALRMAPDRLVDGPAREAYECAAAVLPGDLEDRPLGEDIAAAVAVLPELVRLGRERNDETAPDVPD